MSSVTVGQNFPDRVYSNNDLHAAALVAIDRRPAIRQRVLEQFPYLNPTDVVAIARDVEFLLTCSEEMFTRIEAGK